MTEGLINRILPFSFVDGPGNRTSIFFQGCDFKCIYCHNPETIGCCTLCGKCVKTCPTKALIIKNNKMTWDEKLCCSCDKCTSVCPEKSDPKATVLSVEQVVEKIKETAPFISGVTFSGGECTLQLEFLSELVIAVNKLGLSTCIDTNGSIKFWDYPDFVDSASMFILDIKSYSPWKHHVLTEVDNKIVLKNFHFLAKKTKLFEVRTVIAPDLLDCENTVRNVSRMIGEANPKIRYKLIKCQSHGLHIEMLKNCTPPDEYMNFLQQIAVSNGCKQVIIT